MIFNIKYHKKNNEKFMQDYLRLDNMYDRVHKRKCECGSEELKKHATTIIFLFNIFEKEIIYIEDIKSSIDCCLQLGLINIVFELIKDNPSFDSNLAIRRAFFYGHLEVVEKLFRDPRLDLSNNINSKLSETLKVLLLKNTVIPTDVIREIISYTDIILTKKEIDKLLDN